MPFGRLLQFVMLQAGLHRLWRLLPRPWRRSIVRCLLRTPVRRARLAAPPGRVVVLGMLRSSTSFGHIARLLADSFAAAGKFVKVKDISAAFASEDVDPVPHPEATAEDLNGEATLVIALTPDQFAYGVSFLPARSLEHKFVIAYCPWELERLPWHWIRGLTFVDEVWVPSRFVQQAFASDAPEVTTKVVPPVRQLVYRPRPQRQRWGLSETAFVVLQVLTLRSGLERKNPEASIRAFRAAFRNREEAVLVIKVSDADLETEAWRALRLLAGDDPRIVFITEHCDETQLWGLISAADAVISLHRAEGFGLVPAQAMLLGKPVVATAWSGNMDFMSPSNSCLVPFKLVPVNDPSGRYPSGMSWAEPCVEAAAAFLRELYDSPARRAALGEEARLSMEAYIGASRIAAHEAISGAPAPEARKPSPAFLEGAKPRAFAM